MAAVKGYWSRLWAPDHVHDQVIGIADVGREQTVVWINQEIRGLHGELIPSGVFEHAYVFCDGLVLRMDLRKL